MIIQYNINKNIEKIRIQILDQRKRVCFYHFVNSGSIKWKSNSRAISSAKKLVSIYCLFRAETRNNDIGMNHDNCISSILLFLNKYIHIYLNFSFYNSICNLETVIFVMISIKNVILFKNCMEWMDFISSQIFCVGNLTNLSICWISTSLASKVINNLRLVFVESTDQP